jgi:hypothetical protein
MIGASMRRGLVAGMLAGALAGLVALLLGEPAVNAAVALEPPSGGQGFPRALQLVGLPIGTALVGLGVGALFAVASLWAVGRVGGDVLRRSLKLGAAALYAVVLLPALKYPPSPPAVGDPETISTRTGLYLGLVLVGLVLMAAAWAARRQLGLHPLVVGAGLVAATVAVLVALPSPETSGGLVPPELLVSFRVRSLAVQTVLYGGTALAFGLLARRAES